MTRGARTALRALAAALLLGGTAARAQLPPVFGNVNLVGPRVGVSIVPEETRAGRATGPLNSLFGWTTDLRYATRANFEGFLEAGVFFEGAEHGVQYTEGWTYIGFRQRQGFGIGIGPSVSTYGVGLGIAPAYYFRMDRLMVPVTFATILTSGNLRFQLHTGFSFVSN